MKKIFRIFAFLGLALVPGMLLAQDAEVAGLAQTVAEVVDTSALSAGDTAWMLTATVLVLFMTLPGLALFYGGLVRAQNVLSVLMHCFAIACLASVLWVVLLLSLIHI